MKHFIRLFIIGVLTIIGMIVFSAVTLAERNGTWSPGLVWTLSDDGILEIKGSESGHMNPFSAKEFSAWREYSTEIQKVIIQDGIKNIAFHAFDGCINLKEVVLPDSITDIDYDAFDNCSNLIEITIPVNVSSIRCPAFKNCTKLVSINVAEGNEQYISIDGVLFEKKSHDLITFPAGKDGTNYIFPEDVTCFGHYAFADVSMLKSLKIPNGIVSIGAYCFMHCNNMIDVYIPKTVTKVMAHAFSSCNNLSNIYYGGTEKQWKNIDIDKSMDGNEPLTHAIVFFINQKPEDNFIVASGNCGAEGKNTTWKLESTGLLTISGTGAMKDYEDLCAPWYLYSYSIKKVEIENGVTSIGRHAFSNCIRLGEISIPNSVTIIKNGAFAYCSNLSKITIPNSVAIVEPNVFRYCGLKRINIGSGVTEFDDDFAFCTSLTDISVSTKNPAYSSVNGIFFNKNKTKLVCYPAGRSGSYEIPKGVVDIEWAFFASGITSVILPEGMTVIGGAAFDQCANLLSVTVPASIKKIDGSAFFECNSLQHVYYEGTENEWKQIEIFDHGNDALNQAEIHFLCPRLRNILELPSNLTTIESKAFANLSTTDAVNIPDTVTNIADDAFSGSDLVIITSSGSYAEEWAEKRDIPCRVQ